MLVGCIGGLGSAGAERPDHVVLGDTRFRHPNGCRLRTPYPEAQLLIEACAARPDSATARWTCVTPSSDRANSIAASTSARPMPTPRRDGVTYTPPAEPYDCSWRPPPGDAGHTDEIRLKRPEDDLGRVRQVHLQSSASLDRIVRR